MSADLALLIALCAPAVHPTTAHALVQHESGGHPWAVGLNGARLSGQPATREHAVGLAKTLMSLGYSVDIGYAQINSITLRGLGLTVEQGFEPCTNLSAMQSVLVSRYKTAAVHFGEGQNALQAALSAYNTGNMRSGLTNGYVGAVYRNAKRGKDPRGLHPDCGTNVEGRRTDSIHRAQSTAYAGEFGSLDGVFKPTPSGS